MLMLARLRALLISTGGAMGAACGNGIFKRACVTSGGGAMGATSRTGVTSFGGFAAATGGACGNGLESTMSGIGALARILGALGATMVRLVLSAHFGIAIAAATRLRASAGAASRALELRLITGDSSFGKTCAF